MLIEYTPISSLSEADLNSLKAAVRGMTLESSRTSFAYGGKVFNMRELISAKQMWEAQHRGPGQNLFG